MRKLCLLIFILISHAAYSQIYIVKDPDGYSNLRKGKSTASEIIAKIPVGEVVFEDMVYVDEEQDPDWAYVEYRSTERMHGYLHRSRLLDIAKLPEFKPVLYSDSIVFKNNIVDIKLTKGEFNAKQYHIEYDSTGSYVLKINGKTFFGTDGDLPKIRYESIGGIFKGKQIAIPALSYADTFEPNFDNTHLYYDADGNRLFLQAWNSDGAGGYIITWCFKDGNYKWRQLEYGF